MKNEVVRREYRHVRTEKKNGILDILKSTKLSGYCDKYESKWWKCWCFFLFFFYTFKCQRLNFRLRKYSFHDTEACRISFPFPARRFLWWVIRTWLHCMYAARGSSCRCVMFSSRKMQQHYEWRACALRHVAPPPAHYFQTDVHYSLHIIPQIIFTQEAMASDSFMLNYNFNYNFIITIKLTFLENSQKLINKE